MRKRMEEFEKKSPRYAKVNDLKQKLPYLNTDKTRTSIEFAAKQRYDPANLDIENFTPMRTQLDNTMTSFQSKGLQLHKMEKSFERRMQEMHPASPQPGQNKKNAIALHDTNRMNVTHTDGRFNIGNQEAEKLLDQESNVSNSLAAGV